MNDSLYKTLGVAKTASNAEIKKAYKKLARTCHPDLNPGDAAAEEQFKLVSAAYDILGDADKRKLYDEFGEDASRVGFDPEEARAYKKWQEQARWRPEGQRAQSYQADTDLFEGLFGGRRAGPRQGVDVHADLATDFRTAAVGGVRTLTFAGGQSMEVRIPPGVSDGGSIRLRGKGRPGMQGGPPGDLIITLRVEPHPVFRREGDDVHVEVPITVVEAMTGASIEVPTLSGSVRLRVPEKSQTGQTLRVRGRGVARKDRAPGHLYAHLQVRAPDGSVSQEVLEALSKAYLTDIRAELKEAT